MGVNTDPPNNEKVLLLYSGRLTVNISVQMEVNTIGIFLLPIY